MENEEDGCWGGALCVCGGSRFQMHANGRGRRLMGLFTICVRIKLIQSSFSSRNSNHRESLDDRSSVKLT